MRELRLVPSALMVGAVILTVLLGQLPLAVILLVVVLTALVVCKQFGQFLMVFVLGIISLLVTWLRMRRAPEEIAVGTVTMSPTATETGYLLRLSAERNTYPVFVEELPEEIGRAHV